MAVDYENLAGQTVKFYDELVQRANKDAEKRIKNVFYYGTENDFQCRLELFDRIDSYEKHFKVYYKLNGFEEVVEGSISPNERSEENIARIIIKAVSDSLAKEIVEKALRKAYIPLVRNREVWEYR